MILTYASTEKMLDIANYIDLKECTIVTISNQLEVDYKRKDSDNVLNFSDLVPPAEGCLSYFMRKGKVTNKYIEAYYDYLNDPRMRLKLMELLEQLILYNKPVILLCNPMEYETKYLKLICEYMQDRYGVPYLKYKDFLKVLENDKVENYIKTPKKVLKKITKVYEEEMTILSRNSYIKKDIKKIELKRQLTNISDDELKKLAKSMGIKKDVRKSLSRKELINRMLDDQLIMDPKRMLGYL